MVIRTRLPEADHKRLDAIIRCLQKSRCAIKASRQPASLLEPDELMVPGTEYARTMAWLVTLLGLRWLKETGRGKR
jgi:hypothetical protein